MANTSNAVSNTLVVPAITKVGPYYDDFDDTKNYMRILFRPGYSVQARELTQLQTILQNQVERFGQNIFQNGSSVLGGVSDITTAISLNLASTYANTTITASDFKDKTIVYASGNTDVLAQVVQTAEKTDTEPPTLMIKYLTGTEFGPSDSIMVQNSNVYANVVSSSNATSNGVISFIYDSVYFFDGFFIKVPTQSIIVEKYTTQANARIGLQLSDGVITESNDISLLDPALEASNYQAPGATRYQADLVLSTRPFDSTDDSKFFDIAQIQNGVLVSQVVGPQYNEILDVMAERTYDQAGNYTVKPFLISLKDNPLDPTSVDAFLSPGKAYIFGYEYATISPTRIIVPKARTTQNVINQELSLNYGNYCYVDNVGGVFALNTMEPVDMHSVPYPSIDFSSLTNYNKTRIGTTRIRDLNFFSGDSVVPNRTFELYIFDTNFNSISGTVASNSASLSAVKLAANTSSVVDAYLGATITITSGPGAGNQRKIIGYNGSTQTANVNQPFSALPTTSSHYTLGFDFGEVESFVASSSYTSGSPSNANCNISLLSKGGQSNGVSSVTEPSLLPLIFSYPDSFLANNITNIEYEYRKTFTGVQFNSGNSTSISSGSDFFVGESSASNIASTVTQNFMVVCTDNQGSGRANGEQIAVASTISGTGPQGAVFTTGNTSESFLATIYAKMETIGGTGTSPRVLTLSLANTANYIGGSASNTFINSTKSNTSVYLAAGQVVIQNPSKVVGVKESLFISNVIAVPAIYDLAGAAVPSAGTSLSNYNDVTDHYTIFDGQTDAYFDHASIALKPGFVPPKGPLIVCVRYYNTTTDSGYFSIDSFPQLSTEIIENNVDLGTGYSIIPSYTDSRGNSYRRGDSIDFRPTRTNATNTSPAILTGIKIPIPATPFQSNYKFYLGRTDIIALSGNKSIISTMGAPSKYPQPPTTPARSMVLYVLNVPPYTLGAANVTAQYIDNRNYTMKDIGLLDKRLSAVEYYVQLSQLEQSSVNLSIKDVNGLDRTKQGILADPFTDLSLADTSQPDFASGIDSTVGAIVPMANTTGIDLVLTASTDVVVHEDKVLLEYITVPFLTQNAATKTTPVADYLFASFEGNLYTVPEADIWKDTQVQPETLLNTNNVTNSTTNVIQIDTNSVNR